jgi:hypothetical protein
MSSDSDVRSRYLALALDARKLIDVLIDFVDRGERRQGFDNCLQEVIDSLNPSAEEESLFSPLHNPLAFSEFYEQVQTVNEALKPNKPDEIVQKLLSVKAQGADENKQKQDAFEAIKLLSAIESRALYHYRPQP